MLQCVSFYSSSFEVSLRPLQFLYQVLLSNGDVRMLHVTDALHLILANCGPRTCIRVHGLDLNTENWLNIRFWSLLFGQRSGMHFKVWAPLSQCLITQTALILPGVLLPHTSRISHRKRFYDKGLGGGWWGGTVIFTLDDSQFVAVHLPR